MLPNVGTWELIIILLVVFLVFGSKRLPDIASGLGKGIRAFKREMQGISDEINRPVDMNKPAEKSPPPQVAAGPDEKKAVAQAPPPPSDEDAPKARNGDTSAQTT